MHIPVLLNEVVRASNVPEGGTYLDGTLGSGGHAVAIYKAYGPRIHIVGFDKERDAIMRGGEALKRAGATPTLINESFDHMEEALGREQITSVDTILLDLGISSVQLDDSGRGFTFQKDEPLTMTMEETPVGFTAGDIVNTWEESSIADVIFGYGEERFARRIARAIVEARKVRPIRTTFELRDIVAHAIPRRFHSKRINPATKTFQALRIAVNDELETLKRGLESAVRLLKPNGRLLVITFHSLEDRIVKQFFKTQETGTIITKKPLKPTDAEVKANPRARSAQLRIYQKS